MKEETGTVRQIPKEIAKARKKWEQQVFGLRTIHALLGMLAITSSLLVAANWGPYGIPIQRLAFIAALSVSLLSALDIGSKANRMRRAWRRLNVAIIKFEEKVISVDELIKAYEDAEEMIGDVKELRNTKDLSKE
ncbi:MAG: hypothetical protein O8C62_00155 [Candidatus Methanoperedens sp.]|nr:hypothetical protein [Candidatus Methanoperedens sp.]